jgi:hypothetical protein
LDSRVVFLRDNVKREASCMYYGCACARVLMSGGCVEQYPAARC